MFVTNVQQTSRRPADKTFLHFLAPNWKYVTRDGRSGRKPWNFQSFVHKLRRLVMNRLSVQNLMFCWINITVLLSPCFYQNSFTFGSNVKHETCFCARCWSRFRRKPENCDLCMKPAGCDENRLKSQFPVNRPDSLQWAAAAADLISDQPRAPVLCLLSALSAAPRSAARATKSDFQQQFVRFLKEGCELNESDCNARTPPSPPLTLLTPPHPPHPPTMELPGNPISVSLMLSVPC